jgi:hypothetical protein
MLSHGPCPGCRCPAALAYPASIALHAAVLLEVQALQFCHCCHLCIMTACDFATLHHLPQCLIPHGALQLLHSLYDATLVYVTFLHRLHVVHVPFVSTLVCVILLQSLHVVHVPFVSMCSCCRHIIVLLIVTNMGSPPTLSTLHPSMGSYPACLSGLLQRVLE